MHTHKELVQRSGKWLKQRKRCGVVMLEWYGGPGEIPDAIGFTYTHSYLIEVKISYNDFKNDFKKHFRKRMGNGMGEYRYYLAPKGVIPENEIPENWGLLEIKNDKVYVTREAKQIKRGVMTLRKENQLMVNALRAVICSTRKDLESFRLCNDENRKKRLEQEKLKKEKRKKDYENLLKGNF